MDITSWVMLARIGNSFSWFLQKIRADLSIVAKKISIMIHIGDLLTHYSGDTFVSSSYCGLVDCCKESPLIALSSVDLARNNLLSDYDIFNSARRWYFSKRD
jgi:hypothetical protein